MAIKKRPAGRIRREREKPDTRAWHPPGKAPPEPAPLRPWREPPGGSHDGAAPQRPPRPPRQDDSQRDQRRGPPRGQQRDAPREPERGQRKPERGERQPERGQREPERGERRSPPRGGDRRPQSGRWEPAGRDARAPERPGAGYPERGARRREEAGPKGRRPMRVPPPGQRLRNVRLVIEYDGTRFKGWQIQADARTVAGTIEKALATVVGEPVRLVGAGRTDEGVHAEGQVANFLSRFRHPAEGLVRALNDELPDDVAIVRAEDVGPQFHARHSASSRVYRYHIARRRSPFLVRRAWVMPKRTQPARLNAACALVKGFHDFAGFTDKRLLAGASTTVDVTHVSWKEVNGQLVFRIAASHFLPRMVRRLVGCIVRVGTGELSLDEFRRWLETGEGESGALTAPAMGLLLEHVEYPKEALEPEKRRGTHPLAQEAIEALEEEE